MKNQNLDISEIYDLMCRLGVTSNYTGFFNASYAVYFAIQHPECLMQVTKWLYPEVAKHYGTTPAAVEHSIRAAVDMAWSKNRAMLETIARYPLGRKPKAAEFISIMAVHFSRKKEND